MMEAHEVIGAILAVDRDVLLEGDDPVLAIYERARRQAGAGRRNALFAEIARSPIETREALAVAAIIIADRVFDGGGAGVPGDPIADPLLAKIIARLIDQAVVRA
jgi:hypothetical protein